MDLASIIGIIGAFAIVMVAILLGGSFGQFVDLPSILIVVGGGLAATLIRFSLGGIGSALALGAKVGFGAKNIKPRDLIEEISGLAEIVRKSGPLGLENAAVSDPTLAKGVQYIADGYEIDFIRESMMRERDLTLSRLAEGKRVFKALGDSAPAFGMIGTLVGLVQMLANMDDPSAIGPSMAIALLTTLYGALISNCFCLPMVDKLDAKFDVEEVNQTLIIDGILQIRESKSPALIREMLIAYLPESARAGLVDAA
ncbi:motility protein A [Pannonibacter sp. Q-1]|uniref:Flagellar motor protein PomA n=1 Tax=Pannonibacter phragmitetus TaxID=121719 RepID=A0A0L0J2M0_9HYPH|nr:MotA/TolQ/ExbB proton channel family protein [Pannonibacter phragmitetus]ALV27210.1 flagellar motor protein PomA [Pannonibacter phragmitetus]KND19685.1 flagellar motor protein PomA [Pannonibacter phragmitetus]MBA4207563.1 flagellar motor protein [Polymorphum sp.]